MARGYHGTEPISRLNPARGRISAGLCSLINFRKLCCHASRRQVVAQLDSIPNPSSPLQNVKINTRNPQKIQITINHHSLIPTLPMTPIPDDGHDQIALLNSGVSISLLNSRTDSKDVGRASPAFCFRIVLSSNHVATVGIISTWVYDSVANSS